MKYYFYIFYLQCLFLIIFPDYGEAAARASNVGCKLPQNPASGQYKVAGSSKKQSPGDNVPSYTILQYTCDEGYFVTSNISYCRDGKWSISPECQKRKVVCYFVSWVTYRKDEGKFDVEDVDPNLCTHLIFAFVGLSDEPGIRIRDRWNELYDNYGKGALSRFVRLKETNPDLKVMIAIGGEGSDKFSQAFNTSEKRQIFTEKAVEFLSEYEFDGLDIVWEFPAYNGGSKADKENFTDLLKKLREAFDKNNFILSAVVAASENYMNDAYDAIALGKYLDFINVKAYDLHGSWESVTAVRSPLFRSKDEIGSKTQGLNIDSCIQSWINYGAPAHKLVLGVGLFGRSFNLSTVSCKLPRCPASGAGAPGKLTNEAGLLGYNEICLLEKDSSAVSSFDKEAMTPFLVKDNLWVGYDNKKSLELKINFLLYNNLGGVGIWSLDTDDFTGACGEGKFPLTSFIHKTVVGGKPTGPIPKPYLQEGKKSKGSNKHHPSERVLVCYYASWSVYRTGEGKFDIENIDPNLCTHIIFAYVGITDDIGIKVRDPWNDLYDNYGRGALTRFARLKDANPNLVVLLSIGGYGEPSEKFSQSVDTPEKRNFFVQNSKAFLLKFGFDGLDIDWEFPGQRGGARNDRNNFAKLLDALRKEYDKNGLLITALVASTQVGITQSYDIKALAKYLDLIHVKTFDMNGPWNAVTGHNSPLFGNENDRITSDATIKNWIKNGAPANKLVLGIATYGRSFTLASKTCTNPACASKGSGKAGNLTNSEGTLGYNEVDYILANNLAGALVWTMDTDDFNGACGEGNFPMISALKRTMITEAPVKKEDDGCPPGGCSPDQPEEPEPPTVTQKITTTEEPKQILAEPANKDGCVLPEFPYGGQYEVGNYQKRIVPGDVVPPYSLLTYSCKKNFVPSASIAFCQDDSTWSASPVCNRRCRMPKSYTVDYTCWTPCHNPIKCEEYVSSGSIVRFQCKHYHHSANFYNYHMTCDDGVFDYAAPRCIPECGVEPSEGVPNIISGVSAKRGTFPWHVAIFQDYGNETAPDYQQICGGSIITTHLVISAAHCFYLSNVKRTNSPSVFAVGAGKISRNWINSNDDSGPFAQKSKVKNIFIPQSYGGDAQSHQSDIALLELVTPIDLSDAVHPVCVNLNNDDLNRHHLRTDNIGKIAGWGLTAEDGNPSDDLRYLSVPIIDYAQCKDELDNYNFGKYLTLDKICAGYTNGSSVCRGDSGGGLVFSHRETAGSVNRWYLRGIVSVGPRNDAQDSCRRNTYTAYTQVHYFKEWISKKFVELKV